MTRQSGNVRRFILVSLLLAACSAPSAAPVAAPETPAPPRPSAPAEEKVVGTVHVTASALNVRREPSADGEVLAQVKKGTSLDVLQSDESWVKVRLTDGSSGWVAARFVSDKGETRSGTPRTATRRKSTSGCPADSDYAFVETPRLTFSDSSAHGLVVVEATVNASGVVTGTKVMSNTTHDDALAFGAEREIKSAKFSPPIRNCVARSFIFTYRRTF